MKKGLILILLSMMLLLTSCNKASDDNATIQIWWYNYDYSQLYTSSVENIISKIQIYCTSNEIPVEVVKYGEDTLSYEDYILKRNTAMANGNMITIDDARNLHSIAHTHADYSKLENYNKLLDAYKDKFCIPLGVGYRALAINNDAIEYYGINADKNIITNYDYLEIKQQMKEKGARFKLNKIEHSEIFDYYIIKNGLGYLDEKSEIINSSNQFKEAMKKTVIESYEDFKLYYEDCMDFSFLDEELTFNTYQLLDKTSELYLIDEYIPYMLLNYSELLTINDEILNKSFVVCNDIYNSPCAFLYKKVTNNKIYDVFNQMLSDSYYRCLVTGTSAKNYFPTIDTEGIRKFIEVDENWEHNGILKATANQSEKNAKVQSTINDALDMLVKNKETSNYIASYYFSNSDFYYLIHDEASGLVEKLIVDNLDYRKKEVDDMLNKSIADFITNFNIHNK